MVRKSYLDILRGISILFVVYAHVCRAAFPYAYLFGFCMVPFFFVSGAVFDRDKFKNFRDFVASRLRNLIVPYVLFYLLTYFYWLLVERNFRGGDLSVGSQLVGLFYGTYDVRFNNFNGALWFLPALFTMEVIYWFLDEIKNKWIEWGLMAGLYLLFFYFNPVMHKLPWGMFEAVMAVSFYAIGHTLSGRIEKFNWKILVLIMVLAVPVQLALQGNTLAAWRVDESSTNPLYSYLLPLAGLSFYVALSLIIKSNRLLEWIGRNSMVIYALHAALMRGLVFLLAMLLHLEDSDLRGNMAWSLVITVLIVVILSPFCVAWSKWVNPYIKSFLNSVCYAENTH